MPAFPSPTSHKFLKAFWGHRLWFIHLAHGRRDAINISWMSRSVRCFSDSELLERILIHCGRILNPTADIFRLRSSTQPPIWFSLFLSLCIWNCFPSNESYLFRWDKGNWEEEEKNKRTNDHMGSSNKAKIWQASKFM